MYSPLGGYVVTRHVPIWESDYSPSGAQAGPTATLTLAVTGYLLVGGTFALSRRRG
jgi:hypothetical protein